jgi:hypothetical protein
MKIMNIHPEIVAIITSVSLLAFLAIVFRLFTTYKAGKKDAVKASEEAVDYMNSRKIKD